MKSESFRGLARAPKTEAGEAVDIPQSRYDSGFCTVAYWRYFLFDGNDYGNPWV
jgi:hypothetical protein